MAVIQFPRVTLNSRKQRVKTRRHIQFNLTHQLLHKSGHWRTYKLRAVLQHSGDLPDDGHWVSYVLAATGEWILKNDSADPRVIPVSRLLTSEASVLIYSVDEQTNVPTVLAGCNLGELPVVQPPDDNESSDPSGDGGGFTSDESSDVDMGSALSSGSGATPRAATPDALSSGDDFISGDTVKTASLSYQSVYEPTQSTSLGASARCVLSARQRWPRLPNERTTSTSVGSSMASAAPRLPPLDRVQHQLAGFSSWAARQPA